MYMLGSRLGYTLAVSSDDAGDSLGLRFTTTSLDILFPARYSAPLHSVAYWIREATGNPQRDQVFASVYVDNGNPVNPGTPLQTISAGSGTYGFGRFVISGFNVSLTKGVRYRIRLTTTNNLNDNFGEFSLGPLITSTEFNHHNNLGYLTGWHWNSHVSSRRFNCQVFQMVDGEPVSDHVLIRYSVSRQSQTVRTITPSTGDTGVRVTPPPGTRHRFFAVRLGFVSFNSVDTARSARLVVKSEGKIVTSSLNKTTTVGAPFPIYVFNPPLELVGGRTYDILFSVSLPSASISITSKWIDSAYVPAWLQRFRYIYNGTVVNDEVLPVFQLFMDDYDPMVKDAGLVTAYTMMPVG